MNVPDSDDSDSIGGGCLCGAVRFRVTPPTLFCAHCHCSMCRKSHGASYVTWFGIPRARLAFEAGEDVLVRHRSSEHGTRTFCPRCGTPLTFCSSRFPDELDVTTCSLEDPERLPPRDHTRTSARLSWVKLADGLPEFPEARP